MNELSDLESRAVRGASQIDFTATERRTKRLLAVENVRKSLGGRELFRDLNFTLTPAHASDCSASTAPGRRRFFGC
jgi:ATP-binding cassette subfamily F protein uup